MCKGETVQRSYLLKYAAKLRMTRTSLQMDFCRLGSIHTALEDVLSVLPVTFRVLRHTMEKYVFFLRKVVGGALSSGGLLLVTFVNIRLTVAIVLRTLFCACVSSAVCRQAAQFAFEKSDFPSSKPPIASAMISNLSNNGFLLCAVFF